MLNLSVPRSHSRKVSNTTKTTVSGVNAGTLGLSTYGVDTERS